MPGRHWKEYKAEGTVCGILLPPGLRESERLPEPMFTPATKAQTGHDVNVPFEYVANRLGAHLAGQLRNLTLQIYQRAADYALERGMILADTKFEFGFIDGKLILADEVLTPDSSRYWPAICTNQVAHNSRSINNTSAIIWRHFLRTSASRSCTARKRNSENK